MKELLAAAFVALLAVLAYNGVNIMPVFFIAVIAVIFAKRFELLDHIQAKEATGKTPAMSVVGFEAIGGQQIAKRELMEALDLLRASHGNKLGVRPLGGILLQGPPGTGKTLLARAAASYTDSVFVSAAGSEFVEMYAGVGAKRVRELFHKARTMAKRQNKDSAVVFIDELDVVGAKRGKVDSHMEYDQTLNQLLVELDGIDDRQGVKFFVLGATNRADMLDEALLRPGRFDRLVDVELPDWKGRLEILRIHVQDKPLAADVNLEEVAQQTYGFSGAHLANLVNEAAIQAMRRGDTHLHLRDFLDSIDKVQLGESREGLLSAEEKWRVACHECGHALLSEHYFPGSVSTVTIVPRTKTLGFIRQKESTRPLLQTHSYLTKQLGVLLAGGAAEELMLGERSTGSANDYQRALEIAELIVNHGLSRLGIVKPQNLDRGELNAVMAEIIAAEEKEVKAVLSRHIRVLEQGARHLVDAERLTGDEFRRLLNQAKPN